MSYDYLVLGSGVGKAIAYTLAQFPDTKSVAIGDGDEHRADMAKHFVNLYTDNNKCRKISFNPESESDRKIFSEFNVIINALPAKYNYCLGRTALKYHVPICDLGGVLSITTSMVNDFDMPARFVKLSIVPDCGIMPGLGMMIAKASLENFDSIDSIVVFVGGLPQKPKPPIFYQKVFHIDGLESLCYDTPTILKDGKVIEVAPMSNLEYLSIDNLAKYSPDRSGIIEAFISAGASITPWSFERLGVKSFCEKTVRWPGFIDFIRDTSRKDFSSKIEKHTNIPIGTDNPDLVWMRVSLQGRKNRSPLKKNVDLLNLFDNYTGLTAMENCTGIPTAFIAKYIAKGLSWPGVLTPDQAFKDIHLKELLNDIYEYLAVKEYFL